MLYADKQALERDLAQQMANLQVKELQYLHTNFQNMAITCALLVGFGFTGLGLFKSTDLDVNLAVLFCLGTTLGFDYTHEPQPTGSECVRLMVAEVVGMGWAGSCALGLTWNLVALFICTITSITGPGMALRGPEGSLNAAIAHMEQQNKRALRFFGRGLVAFTSSVVFFGFQAFVALAFVKGAIIATVGICTIYSLQLYGSDIGSKFHLMQITKGEFTTSRPPSGRDEEDGGSSALEDQRTRENDDSAPRSPLHRPPKSRRWCCRQAPWLPSGMNKYTALWRLDKLVVVPYHEQLQARGIHEDTDAINKLAELGTQTQRKDLIRRAQGSSVRPIDNTQTQNDHLLQGVTRLVQSMSWSTREQEGTSASAPSSSAMPQQPTVVPSSSGPLPWLRFLNSRGQLDNQTELTVHDQNTRQLRQAPVSNSADEALSRIMHV